MYPSFPLLFCMSQVFMKEHQIEKMNKKSTKETIYSNRVHLFLALQNLMYRKQNYIFCHSLLLAKYIH